jgi:hypothetical protein
MARHAIRSPFAPLLAAFLLYLFLAAWQAFAGAVAPWLIELWEQSPRLGALGWLALLSSPVAFVALAHRAGHRVLDRFDGDAARAHGTMASLRAGCFAWFAMWFASMASALLLLAIFPPPPDEATLTALWRVATDVRLAAGVHSLLWIGVAALLFHVDRAAAARD